MNAKSLEREWIADESKNGWGIEVHFSPDAKRAAGVSEYGNLYLIDVEHDELLFKRSFSDPGTGAGAWSPDGKLFVAAGTDLNVFETNTFKQVAKLEGHRGPVGGVCFNPTGTRICSAGSDGLVYLWDVATGALLVRIPVLESGRLNAVEWSPDGKELAMVSESGELIVLGSKDVGIQEEKLETIDEDAIQREEELLALSRAIENEPEQPFHYVRRAEWYAKHLAFERSQTDMESYLEKIPHSGWQRSEAAYAAFAAGDQAAYKRHLALSFTELKSRSVNVAAYFVSAACLNADSKQYFPQILPLAEQFHEENPNMFYTTKPLIMLRLRVGESDSVVELIEPHRDRSHYFNDQILVDSIRAIALARLGRTNEAREALVKAESLVQSTWPEPKQEYDADYGDLGPYVEARTFLNEARQSVQPVPGLDDTSAGETR